MNMTRGTPTGAAVVDKTRGIGSTLDMDKKSRVTAVAVVLIVAASKQRSDER